MIRKLFMVSLLLGAMSACGSAGVQVSGSGAQVSRASAAYSYELSGLTFAAPSNLRVSEDNSYYPSADIVWRGDAYGDRVAQIGSMFQEAARRNTGNLGGTQPVVVDIVLERFHGVTERTRFSFGGTYNIIFSMTVRDADTGAVLEGPRRVTANLDAPGGQEALRLDQIGQTERVRVTDFLASTLRAQLI